MASRLEKLLEQLEKNQKQEEGIVKLAQEDLELLQMVGAAYIQGLVDGLTKVAEEEEQEQDVVDLDGDGQVDHIVADEDEVIDTLQEMVENGEISPEEAIAIAQAIDEYNGTTDEEEMEKEASRYTPLEAVLMGLGIYQGGKLTFRLAKRLAGGAKSAAGAVIKKVRRDKGILGRVKGMARDAMKTVKKNKKVVIPLALLGGAGAGYAAYRHFKED